MKIRESKQTANRIERRQSGPWPGQDHDEKSQCYARKRLQRGTGGETHARVAALSPGQADKDGKTKINEHQQTETSHPKCRPRKDTKRRNVDGVRRRHLAKDADEKQRRPRRGGGERNVLGVVEHGAVPCAAECNSDGRN